MPGQAPDTEGWVKNVTDEEKRQALWDVIEKSRHIVFFGGAGVSTESGIPDFRSEQGVFKAIQTYRHAPEKLLSIRFFEQDPTTFYAYYKALLVCPDARPNAAHIALTQLEREGKLTAIVTQNIDGLHQLAGARNVLELHGSMLHNHCVTCEKQFSLAELLAQPGVPRCMCGGVVRPDIVLYGEELDRNVMEEAAWHIGDADTLIVGGTSLAVYPAAGLLNHYRGKNLILINKTPTPYDELASLVIREPIGRALGSALAAT